jgi:hypothetical protein
MLQKLAVNGGVTTTAKQINDWYMKNIAAKTASGITRCCHWIHKKKQKHKTEKLEPFEQGVQGQGGI